MTEHGLDYKMNDDMKQVTVYELERIKSVL